MLVLQLNLSSSSAPLPSWLSERPECVEEKAIIYNVNITALTEIPKRKSLLRGIILNKDCDVQKEIFVT